MSDNNATQIIAELDKAFDEQEMTSAQRVTAIAMVPLALVGAYVVTKRLIGTAIAYRQFKKLGK